jgi:hypothetical protein
LLGPFQPYGHPAKNFGDFRKTPHYDIHIDCARVSNQTKMLYLVGLGLSDEKDITVRGLEIVKKAERVYLEAYTAVLLVEKDVLVSRNETKYWSLDGD